MTSLKLSNSSTLIVLTNLHLATSFQVLSPRFTVGIQIRLLPQTHSPMPEPFAQSFIVGRGSMIHTSVVPYCYIIGILPAMPDLQIVVLNNQPHKPFKQRLGLQRSKVINLLHMVTDGKHGFPAGDGVRPDHWVDGLKVFADVLGRAAGGCIELEVAVGGGFVELGLCVCCR